MFELLSHYDVMTCYHYYYNYYILACFGFTKFFSPDFHKWALFQNYWSYVVHVEDDNLLSYTKVRFREYQFSEYSSFDTSNTVLTTISFFHTCGCKNTEATLQRWSLEKVFWKYATNLQENIHAEVRLQ